MIEYIKIPKYCPVCGSETEIKNNDGVLTLWCTNPDCDGKLINKIDHLCSKKGLDIKGLSKMTIEKLINWGWLNNVKDLFSLSNYRKEWITKPGFGAKSVDKILNAIEEGKECDLWQFISCLGIPLIGSTVAKDLANHFKCWGAFRNAIDDGFDFETLPNFGYFMNKSLYNYDWTIADNLTSCGFTIHNVLDTPKAKTLDGLTFVITGKLSRARDEIKAEIESRGGKVTGSVSSKTSYLICNDKSSTTGKSRDAKNLNIPIITEEEYKNLLN